MKASSKRIISIALSFLFFIGIFLVYGSLIKPTMDEVGKQRSLVASKETIFDNQRNAVSQVQDLVSQYQNAAKLQETVNLALPVGAGATEAMNQVYAIAKQAAVTLQSLSLHPLAFEATKQALVKRLGKLEAAFAVQGSYDSLKTFIRYLETNVRVANIKSLQFAPAGSGFIQDVLWYLTAGERELLISKTCSNCFDKLFPPDVDNDA